MNPPRLHLRGWLLAVATPAAFFLGLFADQWGCFPHLNRLPPRRAQSTFAPFWDAWSLVEQHHIRANTIDDRALTRGAIRGLLDSLGDSGHTTYLSVDQLQKLRDSLDGNHEGVGVSLRLKNDRPTVVGVVARSPARAAGLCAGDVILAIDGEDVAHRSLEEVQHRLKGPAGTVVRLRVLRRDDGKAIDVPLVREALDNPTVSAHMLPGEPILHVAIHTFAKQADEQLREALRTARARGVKGVVLDLRGNPGGFRDQGVAAASEFLSDGPVMFELDSGGRRRAIAPQPGGLALDLPVIVLVDGNTASAAEIVASALQDHGRAQVVGTRTFGTGTVLQSFPLSDGSAVLLAVAKWLPPSGEPIWHKGLTPNFVVPRPTGVPAFRPEQSEGMTRASFAVLADPQLLKALELLRQGESARAAK